MGRRGWVLFLALGLIWGMPYLLIRIAVRDLDPLIVVFARTTIGALILLPFALRAKSLAQAFRHWKWLAAYTLIEISVPWLLIGYAETRLTSSTAGILISTTPLLAALAVAARGGEPLGGRRLAGLVLGLVGVILLMGLDLDVGDLPAAAALTMSAICYAIGPMVVAEKLKNVQPMGVVTGSLILAAALYLPFAPFVWPSSITPEAAWSVFGLATLCTALAFILFFALIAEVGPARSTVITYINPAVALVLGVIVLSEPLTIGMAVGFPLIIIGSILGTAGGRKNGTARAEKTRENAS
ncbi:MAG: EamA family transporter [Sphingosinicella sp.]|nr:EamA family transporter [Sphingosinicella sp.]